MLLYVRISEALKAKADELVSRGHYSDLSTVVGVALENLTRLSLLEDGEVRKCLKRRV